MIGFYNYTVILTYMSLVSSIIGMTLAHAGKFGAAVFCLALSGFFDMFDGKVARRKTDRTDDEKLFGIQLDSLCDVVAFGAFPAFLCYCMGVTGRIGFSHRVLQHQRCHSSGIFQRAGDKSFFL